MMNSIKFLPMALLTALLLFSCDNADVDNAGENDAHEVVIDMEFSISATLQTRGGKRPLTSIDPWQKVTDMRVYVFKSESAEGPFKLVSARIKDQSSGNITTNDYFAINDFNKTEIWKNDAVETHTYSISPFLTVGYYRLLAVGFDELSPVEINWTVGTQTWDDAVLSLSSEARSPIVGEIFSGYPQDSKGELQTLHITNNRESFSVNIECHRTVAGILLYLKNIPTTFTTEDGEVTVKKLAIVTKGYNKQCNAVSRKWCDELTSLSAGDAPDILPLVTLDLESAGVSDGCYTNTDNSTTFPALGNFVMPSNTALLKQEEPKGDDNTETDEPQTVADNSGSLYLCFYSENDTPIELKKIKLVRSYDRDMETVDDSEWGSDLGLTKNDPFHYNLLANHIYCLGIYGNGIDEPVDLKKEIEEHPEGLRIVVVGSWQYEINIEM